MHSLSLAMVTMLFACFAFNSHAQDDKTESMAWGIVTLVATAALVVTP